MFHGVVGRLSHALCFNYNLIKMLVLWEITKLDKTSVGHLCESIGLMRFPSLMSPRTQVLVSCSETERANHMWRSYGPSLDHCRNLPPCPGATTSSGVYAFTFCTYAMFTFCSPGRRAFTFLYCLGAERLCEAGASSHTFGRPTCLSRSRKPLGPSSEYGRLRSG